MNGDNGNTVRLAVTIILAVLMIAPAFVPFQQNSEGAHASGAVSSIRAMEDSRAGTNDTYLPPATWTYLLYIDGDNSLSSAALNDLSEIQAADISSGINILALVDEQGAGNTHLYYISSSGTQEISLSHVNSTWTDEVNMGDGFTLSDFLLFGETHSYSRYYFLDLWDHGGGWSGLCTDGPDEMEIDELAHALQRVQERTGVVLDIVGFDACLMGEIEVFYQIRDCADYFIGSAETEPGDGWDYRGLFSAVSSSSTPYEVGKAVVDTYVESYSDGMPDPDDDTVTLALVSNLHGDTSASMDYDLASDINELSQWLIRGVREYQYLNNNSIKSSYSHAVKYYDGNYVDLYDFVSRLANSSYPPGTVGTNIKDISTTIVNYWDTCVYSRNSGGSTWASAGGVSIYFPRQSIYPLRAVRLDYYDETDFARDTMWDEFTAEYNSPGTGGLTNSPPTAAITPPSGPYSGQATITGTADDSVLDTNSITAVQVRVDHGPWTDIPFTQSGISSVSWNFDIDTTKMDNGQHTVMVRAYDGLEYSAYSPERGAAAIRDIIVDNPLPDIRPVSIEYNSSLVVILENAGSADSPASEAAVIIDGEPMAIVDVQALSPGENTTLDLGPIDVPGTHSVSVVADPSREVREQDENNNALTSTITVTGYGIKLSVDKSEFYVEEGSDTTLILKVKNTGTYVSTVQMTFQAEDGWDVQLSDEIFVLNPEDERTVFATVTPQGAYAGDSSTVIFRASYYENDTVEAVVSARGTVVILYNDGKVQGQWTVEDHGSGSMWHISDVEGGGWYSGEDSTETYLSNTNTYIVSPSVDLSDITSPYLRLDHMYRTEGGYDGGAVYVLYNGSYEQIEPLGGYPSSYIDALENADGFSGDSGGDTYSEFDLSAYQDKTVSIVIRFASDGSVNELGWIVRSIVVGGERIVHDAAIDDVAVSGITVPGYSLTITAHASNLGVVTETFKVNMKVSGQAEENLGNNTITLPPGGSGTASWTYTPVEEGLYTFTATAYLTGDQRPANNQASTTVGVYTNRPSVVITQPQDGDVVDAVVTVEGTASDPDGTVQKVEISIDNGSWMLCTDTGGNYATWSYDWDTMPYANGTHELSARSYDGYYYSEIYSINVTVFHRPGNTAPVVEITSPTEGATFTAGDVISFTSDAFDQDGDDLSFRWVSNRTGLLSTEQNFTAALQKGVHRITLTVDDGHGGVAQDSVNITVTGTDGDVYYQDDFEAGAGTWVGEGSWELGTPSIGPEGAHSGQNCWGTVLDGYYATDNADWNLTGVIDLTSATGILTLSVWMWYDLEYGYDGGVVLIRSQGGDWEKIAPAGGYDAYINPNYGSHIAGEEAFTGNTNGWVEKTFDISSYAGETVELRFRFVTDVSTSDYYGWYIDDVSVRSGSVNHPPVAVISSPEEGSSYTTDDSIAFDGSSSYDPDGDSIEFLWESSIDGNLGTEATFTRKLSEGSHTITLTVTDEAGSSSSVTVNITVAGEVNHPPVAVISSPEEGSSYTTDDSIAFDGSASHDPDGDSIEYLWESSIDGNLGTEATFTKKLSPGSHRITLKVTDSQGLVGSATVNITVMSGENHPPTVEDAYPSIFAISADEGGSLKLSVNASDSDTYDTLSYAWAINDVSAADFGHGTITTQGSQTYTDEKIKIYTYMIWQPNYDAAGQYTVKVTVSDGRDTAEASWSVTINNVNRAPVAVITSPRDSSTFSSDEEITFDGSMSSDPDGDTLTYVWTSDMDGTLGSSKVLKKSLSQGEHKITLTVKDSGGLIDIASVSITVEGNPVTGGLKADAGDDRVVNLGTQVMFNASGSYDPAEDINGNGIIDWPHEGSNLTFKWEMGDGTVLKGRIVNYTYSSAGTYNVTLTVINGAGDKAYDNITVRVNSPPEVSAVYPASMWKEGTPFTVQCVAKDPDGDPIEYYIFEFRNPNTLTGTVLNQTSPIASYSFVGTGTASILVMAYDKYGAAGSTIIQVEITEDGIDPPVIHQPDNNDVVSGEVTIRGSTTGINVGKVEIKLPGKGWVEVETSNNFSSWQYKWDTTAVPDGEYEIVVRSTSAVGDFEAETTITLTVFNGEGEGASTASQTLGEKIVGFLYTPNGQLSAIILLFLIAIILMAVRAKRTEKEILAMESEAEEVYDEEEDEESADVVEGEEKGTDEEPGEAPPSEEESFDVEVVVDMPCPKCGGVIPVVKKPGKVDVVCPSCGAKGRIVFETAEDIEEVAVGEEVEEEEEEKPPNKKVVKKKARKKARQKRGRKDTKPTEEEIDMSSSMIRF